MPTLGGLEVSKVALGAGALGDARLSEAQAEALVHGALELGVRLFDTAVSYGLSEERLGRYLEGREAAVSTKGGYGASGAADWTGDAVRRGIDQALGRLQRERLEVFHLHSCPLEVLQREELVRALEDARAAGKLERTGYSGDNRELEWAVASNHFGAVEASLSLFDQRNAPALARAGAAGCAVFAKRPLGCAPWRGLAPHDDASRAYAERMRSMRLEPGGLGWDELAVRFAAFSPGVTAVLVGTSRLEHLRACVEAAQRGPLPAEVDEAVRTAFASGGDWPAMI